MSAFPKLVLRRAAQVGLLCLAIFAFLGAGDENARFSDLGHRLMCVCGCNQILLECNHVGCNYSDHMRDELIAAINHGDNDDLVLQAFIQKYGTTVLSAPTQTGFNRVAWIMPYVALVLGLGVVVMVVGAWRRNPPPPPTGSDGLGPSGPGGGDPDLERFRDQAQRETDI
ncbi:MAG TPA: cytochrome c-type biogenesis protein CcmH [Terriglobales bacterium]|nr:cytochrome c-type biogenesis protein CcmH [Terriglobales bacterium]